MIKVSGIEYQLRYLGEKFTTDEAFSHLGTLFGIDNCLMHYALVKMGVVKLKSSSTTSLKTRETNLSK